ncbi:Acyl transferase domain-containing protein [Asanoa hainanensis]|uniref:Acyl transferase domain-containing protein n=1 Tax=Asanoa hainanensis TaxID=560556 RepID=A0A239P1F0_9ACTN|nr:acyltransferase domain-containing protein [Asanoa hainanensis]SNT60961.1 Acyl transferase domain-containing protein [Asanoa hainanensis]
MAADSWHVLRLAGDDAEELERATTEAYERLRKPNASFADLRRPADSQRHRRVVLCQTVDDAVTTLRKQPSRFVRTAEAPRPAPDRIGFMFPGGGAQHAGMATQLYEREPVFRGHFDDCARRFRDALDLDVHACLDPDVALSAMERPPLGLGSLFATSYALAQVWLARGLRPSLLIGHSLGEYVAATLAGVLELGDAVRLVALRAQLMDGLPSGEMLIVQLGHAGLEPLMRPGVSVAAINSPTQCVVSGHVEAVRALELDLAQREVTVRRLRFGAAAHSELIEDVLDEFDRLARSIRTRPPSIPVVSNLSGGWLSSAEAIDPSYWTHHLRSPVRFADGLAAATGAGQVVLLEVGPGTTLSTLARQNGVSPDPVSSLRHPLDPRPEAAVFALSSGELWIRGVDVD